MTCFDDLFELIGGFDRFQMWLLCYTAIVAMWSTDPTIHELVMVTMPHHCKIPILSKLNSSTLKYLAIPYKEDQQIYEQCSYVTHSWSDNIINKSQVYVKHSDIKHWNRNNSDIYTHVGRCDNGWVYDHQNVSTNAISTLDMVCQNKKFKTMANSIHVVGSLIGAIISGPLIDEYGRLQTCMVFLITKCGFLLMSAYVKIISLFFITRLALGLISTGIMVSVYVLITELVAAEYRLMCVLFINLCYNLGQLIQLGFSVKCKGNMYIMYIQSLASSLIMLMPVRYLVESPRWILSHPSPKNNELADKVIRYIGYINNYKLSKSYNIEKYKQTNYGTKDGLFEIFKYEKMKIRLIKLYLVWFILTLLRFGLVEKMKYLTMNNFDEHVNVNLHIVLAASFDFVAFLICVCIMRYYNWQSISRCKYMKVPMINAVILCLIVVLMIMINSYKIIIFILMGLIRVAVSISFTILLVYTMEMVPTDVRAEGLSSCMGVSYVSHFFLTIFNINPEIPNAPLPKDHNFNTYTMAIQMFVLSVLSAVVSLLVNYLPDTADEPLLATCDQAEKFIVNEWNRYNFAPKQMGPITVCISVDSEPESTLNDSKINMFKRRGPF